MKLIGGYRSPYVRRVAVSLNLVGMPYEHVPASPFDDSDAVRRVNPLVRVPTLVLNDGEMLVESYAILDALNELADEDKKLIPMAGPTRRRVMKLAAIALGATDKLIWSVYERRFRPTDKIHQPWVDHNVGQLLGGLACLNARAKAVGDGWLCAGDRISLADVGAAIVFQQTEMARPELDAASKYPELARFALRCSALGAFSSVAPEMSR